MAKEQIEAVLEAGLMLLDHLSRRWERSARGAG
jgi:hypothetical protein